MNSRMSFVVIFLALGLMNGHSLSSKGSKGNAISGKQDGEFLQKLLQNPEEIKFMYRIKRSETKPTSQQKTTTTKNVPETSRKSSTKKPTSQQKTTTSAKSVAEITSEPSSTKPTSQQKTTTTKNVPETSSKSSTKKPTSQQRTTTTKNVAETSSKSSTKKPTSQQKSKTAKNVAETSSKSSAKNPTSRQKTTTTKNVTETPSNHSTTTATTKLPKGERSKHSKSISDQFVHRTNFPVFFMVILVVIVAVYFSYHNRSKIHKFIKRGISTSKRNGPGYLKVKLEDDIDLPREANRQYIY